MLSISLYVINRFICITLFVIFLRRHLLYHPLQHEHVRTSLLLVWIILDQFIWISTSYETAFVSIHRIIRLRKIVFVVIDRSNDFQSSDFEVITRRRFDLDLFFSGYFHNEIFPRHVRDLYDTTFQGNPS